VTARCDTSQPLVYGGIVSPRHRHQAERRVDREALSDNVFTLAAVAHRVDDGQVVVVDPRHRQPAVRLSWTLVLGSTASTASWTVGMVRTAAYIRVVTRSTVSVVLCSAGGNAGSVVDAATVSGRPSGTALSARIRSAMVSLASRAMSTISSSCRCRSRKLVPVRFQGVVLHHQHR